MLTIRDVYGVPRRTFSFGAASSGSAETYVLGKVSVIAAVALFLGFKSKRSSEDFYKSLFKTEKRRFRMGEGSG